MKKLIIILLSLAIIVPLGSTSCKSQGKVTPAPPNTAPPSNESTDKTPTNDDFMILTPEEVSSISGIQVTFEEYGAVPELEAFRGFYKKYEKTYAGSLGIAYLILDPEEAIQACLSPEQSANPNIAPAEKGVPILNGRGCLYGNGNHIKIAAEDYAIHIWNNTVNEPLLTEAQLIQLAEIIAERIPLR